jgi:cellulose synthase/poly-beta-1,6-N-acetylglucosamine synthase-like glycosyltransferase
VTLIAIILVVALVGFYASQCYMTIGFVRKLRNWRPVRLDDADCPKAAVILCLRGEDPFLRECIDSLLCQDYPDYEVRVIVDHESDRARSVAEECVRRREATNVKISILQDRLDTCSLKCSSLLQAVHEIGDSRDVIALIDADASPHPTWLRELVAPLLTEGVGAATGNRWYMPANPSVGATVRYFWNVFAIVQMYWHRIAWGGSLAIRMDVIRQANLLQRWGQAFCEDTMLYEILRQQQLRIEFVPSLIMVNREDCNASSYFRWVRRQLLTARLYHPAWTMVFLHGMLSTILPLALVVSLVSAVLVDNGFAAAMIVTSSVAYGYCMSILLLPLEQSVRQIVSSRAEKVTWMSTRFWLNCVFALPLLQVLYPLALAATVVLKQVDWRGVQYRIENPWDVRLLAYQPYVPLDEEVLTSL